MKRLIISVFIYLFFASLSAPLYADDVEISDPFERWNRGIFWFNDKADRYVLEPIAECYDSVVPDPIQTGVGNFFENIGYPSYFVSDLVQLKFEQAGIHTARFLINTTLGLGGLFDVADEFGLEHHREDFGTALAYHGSGPGPYIVIPFLGPSTLRDGVGRLVDSFLDPIPYIAYGTMDDKDALLTTFGATALRAVQTRADVLDAIDAVREASVDEYLFMQSAYYQYREAVIYDKRTEPDEENPFADDEAFDEEFGDE